MEFQTFLLMTAVEPVMLHRRQMTLLPGKFRTIGAILSTGRTGTMALAEYLGRLEGVTALHEPPPSRHLRIVSNRYVSGKLTRERMIELLSQSRRGLLAKISTPVYVESNNFIYGFLDVLGEVFERPKVIHLVRDPRTFIRSWINFGVFRGLKGLAGRFLPYWLLKPERCRPAGQRRFYEMPPVERLAWYWRAINTHLNRGKDLYGPDYMLLRYEDIFSAQGEGLARLTDFLYLPRRSELVRQAREQRVNASRRDELGPWEQWPDQARRALLEECEPLMRMYGYELT